MFGYRAHTVGALVFIISFPEVFPMTKSKLTWLLKKSGPISRLGPKQPNRGRFAPALESLGDRVLPAVTATFFAADAVLSVVGDALDNTIVVSRSAAGTILVNNGAVAIQGGPATVANTRAILMNGGAGNDFLALNESNDALPMALISGDGGNDTLIGGSGNDLISGDSGNDVLVGGAGDDTFQWLPGDGSDTIEGQDGHDTMLFHAPNDAENFDVSANGNHVRVVRTVANAAEVTMDLNGVEQVDLSAGGGTDTITVNDLSATDVTTFNLDLGAADNASDSVIVNGTNGNDGVQIASFGSRIAIGGLLPFVNITGEGGLDALTVNTLGGNDVVDAANLAATNASQLIKLTENGGAGNDILIGSQGFDTFVWNPGDGSDTNNGGDGEDTMIVNGSDAAEKITISANGTRILVNRDVDGVTMDVGGVEEVDLNPLGGADTVTVNDLTGTALTQIRLDLSGSIGGHAGDGQADSVIFNGTNGADSIPVIGGNGVIIVNDGGNLPYSMLIRAAEGANDRLIVNALGGDDVIDASSLQANLIGLTLIGGTGTNIIRTPLFGDSDGDGDVDANDFAAFRSAFGGSSAIFDFDGDGVVGANDFAKFRSNFGLTI
jgi:hypothetical protein